MASATKSKYYYIKPRRQLADAHEPIIQSVELFVADPEDANPLIFSATPHTLDMGRLETKVDHRLAQPVSKPAASQPAIWIFFKLILLSGICAGLYLGGTAVYAGANNIKANITDLASRGVTKLEAAAAALLAQDIPTAKTNFLAAENLFTTAQKDILSLGQTNLYLSGLASDSKIVSGQKLIDSGLSLAQAGDLLLTTTSPLLQYFSGATTGTVQVKDFAVQITTLLSASSHDLDRAMQKVERAHQLLTSVDADQLDPEYAVAIQEAQTKTATLQEAVTTLATLAKELPSALGFKNPRQYILLNQNNNELRPTGGFLGSYALVQLNDGQIDDLSVDTTQRIDGQLKSPSLEIPEVLRAVATDWGTGEAIWGTRDSNWSPDFPTSAKTFQQLYEDAGGGTADGIIAINPEVLQDILKILGPVEVPSKAVTLTSENVVEVIQAQIKTKDADKQNPKEILVDLAPILLQRIMGANSQEFAAIKDGLVQRLVQKDILLNFKNQRLQDIAAKMNFAGVMPTVVEGDFISVVRANLGGMKSSQRVTQTIDHEVKINLSGTAVSTLKLNYTHTGSQSTYVVNSQAPDGTNRDYIRVYVPLGSKLIASQGQDPDTKVEELEENGKTVFAFWLTTPPKESRSVKIDYQLPNRFSDGYNLMFQKQSGANQTELISTLKLSPALKLEGESAESKTKTLFSGKLVSDLNLVARFTKI